MVRGVDNTRMVSQRIPLFCPFPFYCFESQFVALSFTTHKERWYIHVGRLN